MPAYVIVETEIHDPEQYALYQAATPEGNWDPTRLVVLEFPDLEAAKRWYESPQYQEARRLREGAAALRMVAVQGLDEPL